MLEQMVDNLSGQFPEPVVKLLVRHFVYAVFDSSGFKIVLSFHSFSLTNNLKGLQTERFLNKYDIRFCFVGKETEVDIRRNGNVMFFDGLSYERLSEMLKIRLLYSDTARILRKHEVLARLVLFVRITEPDIYAVVSRERHLRLDVFARTGVFRLGYDDYCILRKFLSESECACESSITRRSSLYHRRSEERRVGKECRSRWSPYH